MEPTKKIGILAISFVPGGSGTGAPGGKREDFIVGVKSEE